MCHEILHTIPQMQLTTELVWPLNLCRTLHSDLYMQQQHMAERSSCEIVEETRRVDKRRDDDNRKTSQKRRDETKPDETRR